MVRLKQKMETTLLRKYVQSQFHYGSIKTERKFWKKNIRNRKSQFHYGSIKTLTLQF